MTHIADTDAENPLARVLSPNQIDALVDAAEGLGEGRQGVEELLTKMTQAVLERALETELIDHLGYEVGDPAGQGSGNSGSGKSTKTIQTLQGPVEITVSRDWTSSFEPVIVLERTRRLRTGLIRFEGAALPDQFGGLGGYAGGDRGDDTGHEVAAEYLVGAAVGLDEPLVDSPGHLSLDLVLVAEQVFEPGGLLVGE